MAKVAVGHAQEGRGAQEREALSGFGARAVALLQALRGRLAATLEEEYAYRRPALWLPVAAGAGAILSLTADREPSLLAAAIVLALLSALAFVLRVRRSAFALAVVLAAVAAGFVAQGLRTWRAAAPVVTRPMTIEITGFVEQVDLRRAGARFTVRLTSAQDLDAAAMPFRVRLTTNRAPDFEAGAHIALKARLMPPSRAALPGGYDFARDAYFMRIGGVGNALGRIEALEPPEPAPLSLRLSAAVDRFRNALVQRVTERMPGDVGAIAAAMVAGKRDHLSREARELIREAGIFHIITIAGVQMTLVAGIFFVGLRRLLALSQTLALNYPIKKWAAVLAIFGAIAYDVFTGSRVGAERALVMTIVMLLAAVFDRPSVSMRNLALAVVFVVLVEPEALMGASFQLSFAAVAALVAVWEARLVAQARARAAPLGTARPGRAGEWLAWLSEARWRGLGAILFATLCATSATASFMAADFHELSPYVLIGNPLTLMIIEFFAVPAALAGSALYPLGLDGPVWLWLGLGIDIILAAARMLAALPAATVHLREFAPWALPFLSLAVLSATIWRTTLFRLTALPFLAVGLYGATQGPRWDVAIQPTGESAAVRSASGELVTIGRFSGFTAEQWLRADADGREPRFSRGDACDKLGCTARTPDGGALALVSDYTALAADCARAKIVVTPLYAPWGCKAEMVIDRKKLEETGAITLRFAEEGPIIRTARAPGEDRPWSPAPKRRPARAAAEAVDENGERAEALEAMSGLDRLD
ncbi:MAG TPA: ComEC/Rec2 family competence protein [Rhodoblastus sp.]|nr:ComEC/Rec2 family competence protein [Rhodoblastus sp.]